VKGLPGGTNEETIRSLFGVYGMVTSVKILPCPAGVSDCAALIRMSSVQEASYIMENSSIISAGLGMTLQIRFANQKGDKGADKGTGKGGGFAGGISGGMAMVTAAATPGGQPSNRLYMRGLPLGTTEEQLQAIMGAYGTVASCKVLPSPPTGATDCACIVQMSSPAEAKWLVDHLDGNIPQGLSAPVVVKYKQDGPPQGGAAAPQGAMATSYPALGTTSFGATGGCASNEERGLLPSDNLYMKGLPVGSTPDSVMAVFGVYGNVTSVKVLECAPGKNDVAALVRMGSLDEAKWRRECERQHPPEP